MAVRDPRQLARLPELHEELWQLRSQRDELLSEYEELQAQIEWQQTMGQDVEELTAL